MGSGGVAIAALPTVICLKVPFSDGLGGDISVGMLKTKINHNLFFRLNKIIYLCWQLSTLLSRKAGWFTQPAEQ